MAHIFLGWMGDPSNSQARDAAWATFQSLARPKGDSSWRARVHSAALVADAEDLDRAEAGTFGSVSVAFIGNPRFVTGNSSDIGRTGAAALAARFREVGAALAKEIGGAFALAIFDSERSIGFVATDRMGIRPLFVIALPGGVAFASAPALLMQVAQLRPSISTQAVFDYLHNHVVPAPDSIFEGVRRLLPGECAEISLGQVTLRRYWQAVFEEDASQRFDVLRENFLAALQTSVKDALQGARCGAFLSGGTDSSTIAGMMTRVVGAPADTFSIGFAAAGFDEMEYARLASKHFGTRHHEYYVTPKDIVAAVPKLAAIHPQPFGNSSALPTYYCAELARAHGIERLLGGDGGDELFGGNARYAKQYVFSLYEMVPRWLRASMLEPASRALGSGRRLPVLSKLASYVQQASVPMPDRLETYNLMHRIGETEILEDSFLHRVDRLQDARVSRDAYFNPSAKSLINRMLALDFKTTLADNDLPKVMQSCALAGLPVRFPMLDERIVDFSLSLRPGLKLKRTQLRWFFKEALRDFLPEAILRKKKHGFGLPFGEWAVQDAALRELTFDSLNDLKRRALVRPQFIDRLKDELLPLHPGYYGTMAWVLMMLERWLQHHMDRANTRATESATV